MELDDEKNLETENASAVSIVLTAPYGVGGVSFSPDGRWLALNSSEYRSSPFSPDGRSFASSSPDTWLYHLRLEDLISLACRTAGRDPTESEGGQSSYRSNCPVPSDSSAIPKAAQ